jgi:SAM-dependent methyltransferase
VSSPSSASGGGALQARGYERAAPDELRARRGLFYTPDEMADVVARGAVRLWLSERTGRSFEETGALVSSREGQGGAFELLRGRTALDPSCGAGALLAAMARILPGVDLNLVGGDIDPTALALSRKRLGEGAELYLGDALSDGLRGDIVLTNPPYGRDPNSADIDRYVTFWRAAIRRVERGGVLAVLAPQSWRTGIRYAAARREVIDASGVRFVIDLPRGAFPDAYVDTCVALCLPSFGRGGRSCAPVPRGVPLLLGSETANDPSHSGERSWGDGHPSWTPLGTLFLARRGILAPMARGKGTPLLLGPVAPFVWPEHRSAFGRVRPRDVVEGKAALGLDRGPRLLVRRIVGRASRLTCVVTKARALVKKDFYVLVPREASLSLGAYSALLHARPIARWLAAADLGSTKEDFAQVTLTRLRQLRVPRLVTYGTRIRRISDDRRRAAAWLEAWAEEGEALGRALLREGARLLDADPRWIPLRARLDAFVARLE